VPGWELHHLFIQHPIQFDPGQIGLWSRGEFLDSTHFTVGMPIPTTPNAQSDPERHSVQPRAQHFPCRNRTRFACQHEECCLECIICIVRVSQDSSTHCENHRGMSADEQLECNLIPIGGKTGKQVRV
jgi:hypothetical protein